MQVKRIMKYDKDSVIETNTVYISPKVFVAFIAICTIALAVISFLYFKERQVTNTLISVNSYASVKQALGKLILLDETEPTTFGTIKNIDLLKKEDPEFYKNAKNGDVLLIYPNRVIVYDTVKNIIVNVGNIITSDEIKKQLKGE
jgi:hypothetical protein